MTREPSRSLPQLPQSRGDVFSFRTVGLDSRRLAFPTYLSLVAFKRGALAAGRMTRMPAPFATRSHSASARSARSPRSGRVAPIGCWRRKAFSASSFLWDRVCSTAIPVTTDGGRAASRMANLIRPPTATTAPRSGAYGSDGTRRVRPNAAQRRSSRSRRSSAVVRRTREPASTGRTSRN